MSTSKVRVGVIGAGIIATHERVGHIPNYKRIPEAEVVAVSDVLPGRAASVAQQFGIPFAYTDYADLLARDDVDAVNVLTPNFLHASVTLDALRHGKHVLCEKPMALTTADATAMVETARAANRKLMIGFNNRFRSDSLALKAFIGQGILGDIYYVRSGWLRRSGIPGLGTWFTNRQMSGGGCLLDLGPHMLDLALWILGHPRPTRVVASVYSVFGSRGKGRSTAPERVATGSEIATFDVEDAAVATVHFSGGATLNLEVSWASHIEQSDEVFLRVWGSDGGGQIYNPRDYRDPYLRLFTEQAGHLVDVLPVLPTPPLVSHGMQLKAFVEAIRDDTPVPTPGEQGLDVVRLTEAMYQSAHEGREVALKTTDNG